MKLASQVFFVLFCSNLMAANVVVRCTDSEGNSKNYLGQSVEVSLDGEVIVQTNTGRGGRPLAKAVIKDQKCLITAEARFERPVSFPEPN